MDKYIEEGSELRARVRYVFEVTLAPHTKAKQAINIQPTNQQTNQPTNQPTNKPTNQQTNQPTNQPTNQTDSQTRKAAVAKPEPVLHHKGFMPSMVANRWGMNGHCLDYIMSLESCLEAEVLPDTPWDIYREDIDKAIDHARWILQNVRGNHNDVLLTRLRHPMTQDYRGPFGFRGLGYTVLS